MTDNPDSPFETLASRTVYRNPWMAVREDRIRRRDGSETIYGVVEKVDFVIVLAVHEDRSIELVEQFRYAVGRRLWELPMGVWKDGTADPVDAARGELREETGLIAGRLTHAGRLGQAPGFATPYYDIFVAEELVRGEPALEPEEADLVSRAFPAETVLEMIRTGAIIDATTIAAIGLLLAKGLFPAAAPSPR